MAIIRRHNGTDWEALDAKNLDGISDGTLTITPDQIGLLSNLQTTNNDNLVNAINEVKQTAGDDLVPEIEEDNNQIKRLLAYEQTKGRVLGGSGVFVDLFDGNIDAIATLDTTKTNATSTLSIGNTTIPLQSATGFSVGQEITVFDDVNLERPTITGINGNNLQVTALTKNFKNGATVCRSSVIVDTVKKCLKFGGWDSSTTYSQFSTVVGNNYSTAGNGSRKEVRLSNGWLVAVVANSSDVKAYYYKSEDNGGTWIFLTSHNSYLSNTHSILSKGTRLYSLYSNGANSAQFVSFDVTAPPPSPTIINVDSGQSSMTGSTSLAINPAGTELHAAWASKNSTYPNSFNIRYAKGTIDGNGDVTWGSVEQRSVMNISGRYIQNPCVVVNNSGLPRIFIEQYDGTAYTIGCFKYDGSSWTYATVYNGSTYTQSNPCAVVDGNDVIHVVWSGKDSTDSSKFNIRYSKSTDGGATWTASVKLTSGNVYDQMNPTATFKNSNQITVLWEGRASGTYNQIRKITSSDGGNTWSSITDVTNQTTAHASNPSALLDLTLDFTEPLFIYQDGVNVKFKGTWFVGTNVPVLVEDLRYNLTSPTGNLSEVCAFVQRTAEMYNEYQLSFTVI